MDIDRSLLKSLPLQPLVDSLLLGSLPEHPLDILNVDPYPSDLTLALFSAKVYTQKESITTAVKIPSQWEMLVTPEGGWRLLTTGSNTDLDNGYFGAAYVNTALQQVVVSHRGTKTSSPGALFTDVYGICWKKYTACTNSAVTFVELIRQVIISVNSQNGRRYNLVITGHSLGGWLAQITAFTVKCLKESGGKLVENTSGGVHAKTVVFDSPGVKTMLNKIRDNYYDRYTTNILDRLDIIVFVSAPNRINTCGTHLGSVYRVMIDVENFNVLHRKTPLYNTMTHGIDNFVGAFRNNLDIHEIFDWPKNTDEFVILFGKDALNYSNRYHKDLGKETNELHKKIQRYNTDSSKLQSGKEIMLKCYFKIFAENELHVLNQLTSIQMHQSTNDVLNKFFSDKKLNFEERNFFPDIEIDHANRTITCKPQHLLREFTNRLKQVMRWFETDFTELVRDQIMALPRAVDSFYRAEGQSFLDSLPRSLLNFRDFLHLQDFLLSDTSRVLCIVTQNGSFEMCRLYNLFSQIKRSFNGSHPINKFASESHYTFLDWPRLQNIFKIYGSPIDQNNLMIVDGTSPSTISLEVYTFLNNYVQCSPSNFKKLVFISSNAIEISNSFQNVEIFPVDREISLMDLTEESQEIIVKRKRVIFTGSKSFSFQEFLGEKCSIDEINHLVSSNCLKGITTNEDYVMNIKDTRPLTSNLQMPFVKTNVITSMEYVLNCIKTPKSMVVTSGLNSEDVEAGADWEQLNGKIILAVGDAELFFKDICNKNQNQIIYLLEVSGDHKTDIHCKQIFNRGFYVPRKFIHRTSIDIKRFTPSANDMFVICSEEHKASLLELIGNDKDRENISKNLLIAATKEEETDVIEKHFSKNIHFVEIEQSDKYFKLEWRFSHGSVERLLYYMSVESFEPIDELTLSRTERNLVFLIDEPGMGKTTSLARLSKLIETAWVIHIELKQFKTHIEKLPTEFTPKNVENFLLSECCSSADDRLAHGSLEYLLQSKAFSKRVVIMFDGFDEIEDYTNNKDSSKEKLIKLIAFLLSKPTIQVFLTARKYLKESLETNLNQFSTSFVTINTQEQQDFLFMFWRSFLPLELDIDREKAEGGLTEYAGEVLRRAKQVLGSDMNCFMGVPLQLRMLAEVFRPKSHLMIQPLEDLYKKINIVNAPNLYKMYIQLKYDIYLHDKTLKGRALDEDEILEYTESLNQEHGELGFRTFFAEFYDLNKNNFNMISTKRLVKLNRLGLIESKGNEKFDFVHRTYAEYFCAQIVIHLLNQTEPEQKDSDFKHRLIKDILLTKILLHPDSKIIRLFLNVELGEMDKSDTTLQLNAEHISRLWLEENSIFRNDEHQTALHIAVKERNEHIITFMLSGLYYKSTQDAFVTLITQYDINNNIALHIMDQPTYHGKIDDDSLCKTIMEMFFKCFVSFSNETKEKILFACLFNRETSYVSKYLMKSGNVNAKTLPEFKKVETRVKEVESVVVKFKGFLKENNVKRARKTLSKRLNNNVELYCLLFRKKHKKQIQSALHIATKHGHIDFVQLLAEILTPVPFAILMARPDEHKKTALHIAAECGHLDIVRYLVESGTDINSRCKTGQSALMYAAKMNYKERRLSFLEVGDKRINTFYGSINKPHTDKEKEQLLIVKCLVEKDANKNFKDHRGLTAVQKAADNDHFLIVEYLIDGGADISLNNIINDDGETALHKAAQWGRHTSVDYLLKKGADPDRVDKRGWTALSWASLLKAWVVVQVLLDGEADINADGGQAFHFAIWWKEWSVVKSLIDKGVCVLESKISFDLSEFKEKFPNYVFK